MKVTTQDAGPCRKQLSVEVPPAGIAEEYDEVLKAYVKVARLPGFRKGKAPADIVEKRYSREIAEDVRQRAVPRCYREALRQESIEPVAIVGVSDVALARDSGLRFNLLVEVAPEFKLPKYRKISVKAEQAEVSDADVEEQVDALRRRLARFEDVTDRALRRGDLAQVDFEGTVDGQPVADVAPEAQGLGKTENFWMLLDEPEMLPGANEGLVGAVIGGERALDLTFPDDYRIAALAGRTAAYRFQVKAVRERIVPDVDEAFLKQVGVESEAALRERVRAELLEAAEQRRKAQLHDEIARFLLEKTKLDLPQAVVEQETRTAAQHIVRDAVQRGATQEQLEAQSAAIVGEAQRSSQERVKLSFILNRIAVEEDIQVADEDVEARIEAMAQQHRMTPGQLRAEIAAHDGLDRLRGDLRGEKTMDFLLEHAKVKDS